MKIQTVLLSTITGISLAISAHADMIQIGFTGTISNVTDTGTTSVFNNTANVGGSLSGVVTFNDTVVTSFYQSGNSQYYDPAYQAYLFSTSIMINGNTYSINPTDGYSANSSQDRTGVFGSETYPISTAYLGNYDYGQTATGTINNSAGSYLNISVSNAILFNSDYSLINVENVLAALGNGSGTFKFGAYVYSGVSIDGGASYAGSYVSDAELNGVITSLMVTNLSQQPSSVPLPSAFILMASGVLGLGFMRRSP